MEQLTDDENETLKMAVIESGDIDLFEYSLLKNPGNFQNL